MESATGAVQRIDRGHLFLHAFIPRPTPVQKTAATNVNEIKCMPTRMRERLSPQMQGIAWRFRVSPDRLCIILHKRARTRGRSQECKCTIPRPVRPDHQPRRRRSNRRSDLRNNRPCIDTSLDMHKGARRVRGRCICKTHWLRKSRAAHAAIEAASAWSSTSAIASRKTSMPAPGLTPCSERWRRNARAPRTA